MYYRTQGYSVNICPLSLPASESQWYLLRVYFSHLVSTTLIHFFLSYMICIASCIKCLLASFHVINIPFSQSCVIMVHNDEDSGEIYTFPFWKPSDLPIELSDNDDSDEGHAKVDIFFHTYLFKKIFWISLGTWLPGCHTVWFSSYLNGPLLPSLLSWFCFSSLAPKHWRCSELIPGTSSLSIFLLRRSCPLLWL